MDNRAEHHHRLSNAARVERTCSARTRAVQPPSDLALGLEPTVPLVQGTIQEATDDDTYLVVMRGRAFALGLAPACLLEPQPRDRVLIAGRMIIAVMERPAAGASTIRCRQPLHIVAPQLVLRGEQALNLSSPTLGVSATQLSVRAEGMALTAHSMTFAAGVLRSVAQSIINVAEHISSSAAQHVRRSKVSDDVHAGSASMHCDGIYQLNADAISALGSKVLKLDGGQVQLG